MWEVRVPVPRDPGTGRRRQLSVTVHGTETEADAQRALHIARQQDIAQAFTGGLPPPAWVTVGDLLPAWLAAAHPWKPSTVVGYRSVVRFLLADPLPDSAPRP